MCFLPEPCTTRYVPSLVTLVWQRWSRSMHKLPRMRAHPPVPPFLLCLELESCPETVDQRLLTRPNPGDCGHKDTALDRHSTAPQSVASLRLTASLYICTAVQTSCTRMYVEFSYVDWWPLCSVWRGSARVIAWSVCVHPLYL